MDYAKSQAARSFAIPKSSLFVYAGVTLIMAIVAGMVGYVYPPGTVALSALVAMVLLEVTSIALVVASLTDDRDHQLRAYVREKYGDRRAPA